MHAGGPCVQACMHVPSACVHAWKPSGSGCGGLVQACMYGLMCVCMGTLRASGHRDLVCACEMGPMSERAWGPGPSACVHGDQAGWGTLQASGRGTRCEWRGDLVRVCVHGLSK